MSQSHKYRHLVTLQLCDSATLNFQFSISQTFQIFNFSDSQIQKNPIL